MNTVSNKKKKAVVLEKGQRIWISSENLFANRDTSLREYEVIRANNTSAYAILVEDKNNYQRHEWRIMQRSLQVNDGGVMSFMRHNVWLTSEAFHDNNARIALLQKTRAEATELVSKMGQKELEEMILRFG